eukprot:473484_1
MASNKSPIGVIFCIFIIIEQFLVNGLSVCKPVDSIFLFESSLIVNNQDRNNVKNFLDALVYEASSERSGVGLIMYGNVPINLDNITFVTLDETKHKKTKKNKTTMEISL